VSPATFVWHIDGRSIVLLCFSGEISYKECSTFSDMSGPAMINTFNDINKLVQARKL
jgi:hypothetical protein